MTGSENTILLRAGVEGNVQGMGVHAAGVELGVVAEHRIEGHPGFSEADLVEKGRTVAGSQEYRRGDQGARAGDAPARGPEVERAHVGMPVAIELAADDRQRGRGL
jgi:hypothetical protein